jgi:hypothetical protein
MLGISKWVSYFVSFNCSAHIASNEMNWAMKWDDNNDCWTGKDFYGSGRTFSRLLPHPIPFTVRIHPTIQVHVNRTVGKALLNIFRTDQFHFFYFSLPGLSNWYMFPGSFHNLTVCAGPQHQRKETMILYNDNENMCLGVFDLVARHNIWLQNFGGKPL